MILLPGLDGTEIFFGPLLSVLPVWIKPVVVTYPTSGANDYAALLPVVRAAIPDSKEFYVLGWSFSGPLALMIAANESLRTRGVILCASFVRPPIPVLRRLRFAVISPVVHVVRLARRGPLFLSRDWSDRFRRDKAATWARVPSRILAARARAVLGLDAREWLSCCQPPLLYVAGSRDRVIPAWNAEEVVRGAADAKVVTIDGPHLALYTNPKAAATAIIEFMRHTEAS